MNCTKIFLRQGSYRMNGSSMRTSFIVVLKMSVWQTDFWLMITNECNERVLYGWRQMSQGAGQHASFANIGHSDFVVWTLFTCFGNMIPYELNLQLVVFHANSFLGKLSHMKVSQTNTIANHVSRDAYHACVLKIRESRWSLFVKRISLQTFVASLPIYLNFVMTCVQLFSHEL